MTSILLTAIFVLLVISPLAAPSHEGDGPVVRVSQGQLRGARLERSANSSLHTLYAFKGVPYARPPVGELRFKDPVEPETWTGIRDASTYGSACVQKNLGSGNVTGEEDCLYLNIFTADPPELWSTTKRPVIVIIHGGAFVQWNGNMEFTRPDPLLKEGVLVVSINYRLGVMGFLNTEDSQAPGNAGLKDQTMALRWVQRNIAAFGGDPNKVTIMGESAGGASVHYHLLSPLSRGLFHGAISVSGSALPAWARVQRPREQALALRRRLAGACPQLPEDDIVSCLRQVDAQELVFNQYDLPREPYQRYILKNTFLPSVETASSSNSPFLTTEPEQLMQEGNFTQVPYMTGFTNGEGIMILHFMNLLSDPSAWAEVDEHFEAIFRWELPPGHRTPEGARQLRRFYLGDRSLRDAHLNNDTLQKFVQLCTDTFFASGTATSARLMADHGAPVYVYQFSRDGPIAFLKNMVYKATHIPGVMHGDDMAYVFDFIVRDSGELRPVPSSERPLRERQVQFIEEFVKYGRPTPEENGVVHWPLFTSVNETYLDINRELSTNRPVLEDRANFWRRLDTENFSTEDSTRQLNSRKR
ncbi:hypothetical protein R5R35_000306 [Gryllus longicercus]|uniref:Carboxylic ester hydrolase n=1 Tax=Gryllus longicercus TaxID=2509291 RepID=A0AAN9VZT0_9ORTH